MRGTAILPPVSSATCILAPSIPDLRALGARDPDDLLGRGGALAEERRARVLLDEPGREVLRCPLPGTPDPGGSLRGRPEGAGTGWVELHRYSGAGIREGLRARFTAPRSTSLAERDWNLLCHLRGHGVATPEPLAVARTGAGPFSRRSVLVVRSLEGFQPARVWLARRHQPAERRRGLRALGLFFRRLAVIGIELPRLAPDQLLLSTEDPSSPAAAQDACGLEQVLSARSDVHGSAPRVAGPEGELSWRRLPEVALADVRGARLAARAGTAGRVDTGLVVRNLARLADEVDGDPRDRRRSLSPGEGLRILLTALPASACSTREARRASLVRLAGAALRVSR